MPDSLVRSTDVNTSAQQIAVLGLGRMGSAIAGRLRAANPESRLVVWNRTASRAESIVAEGVRLAATPADAAAHADIVLTMLADPSAVEAVLFGRAGVVDAIRPGTTLVEMSTIGPNAVLSLAKRLPDEVRLVAAPVLGSVDKAAAGELVLLAGGATADVERVEPVLRTLGTVRHCGPIDAGAARKLVLNAGMIAGVAVLADSVALAGHLGVPEAEALDLLAAGPLGPLVGRIRNQDSQFGIGSAAKDLDLALAAGALGGGPIEAASGRLRAAIDAGLADDDLRGVLRTPSTEQESH